MQRKHFRRWFSFRLKLRDFFPKKKKERKKVKSSGHWKDKFPIKRTTDEIFILSQ